MSWMFRERHCNWKYERPRRRWRRGSAGFLIAFGTVVPVLAASGPVAAEAPGSGAAAATCEPADSPVAARGMRAEELRAAREVAGAVLGAKQSLKQRQSEAHGAVREALGELREQVRELRRAEMRHFATRRTPLSEAARQRASEAEVQRAEVEQQLRQALQGLGTRRARWQERRGPNSMLARGGARARLDRRLDKLGKALDRALEKEGAERVERLRELEKRLELAPARKRSREQGRDWEETPTFESWTKHRKGGGS